MSVFEYIGIRRYRFYFSILITGDRVSYDNKRAVSAMAMGMIQSIAATVGKRHACYEDTAVV